MAPPKFNKLEAMTICGTPEYIAPEVILGKRYNQSVDFYGLGLLIFEMLSGYNPYKIQNYGNNTNMMFEMIVSERVEFSFPKKYFNDDAKHLVKQLMQKNPRKRLGNGSNGIDEIKQHPFFKGIDWEELSSRTMEVPFKPNMETDIDTKYVDKEFLKQSKKDKRGF